MMIEQAGATLPLVTIFGPPGSALSYAIRDFLYRSDVPFEWVQLMTDAQARSQAGVEHLADSRLPVCVFADGTRLECPTVRQITEQLGWFHTPLRAEYDLAIYGAGPAGLSAAVYGASEGLKTVVIERYTLGGQAGSSSRIENYLGFPHGISGAELAERAREQVQRFGAEILLGHEGVRADCTPHQMGAELQDGTKIIARATICATGVAYRRLGLEHEERFVGAGLFYGAGASEAALTRSQRVFVVGGGNAAGQAAMHFAQAACHVTIVIRGDSLKSTLSQYLIERIAATPTINVLTQTEVTALSGDAVLREITLSQRTTGESRTLAASWLFVCIGGEPQTQWAREIGIVRNAGGYLVTGPDLVCHGRCPAHWPLSREPYYLETSKPGLFAAGDVRHGSIKRCASAVGEGAMAMALVHRYLVNG
jgi:thioredoxin reductase (NADPH)